MTYQRLHFPPPASRHSPLRAPSAPGHGGFADALKRALAGLSAALAAWKRERLAAVWLQGLSPHLRADIGLTRAAPGLTLTDIEGVTSRHEQRR